MMMTICLRTMVLGVAVAWSTAAWSEEGGQWRGKAVLVTTSLTTSSVADEQDHQLLLGDDRGLVFNEDGKAFLDKAEYRVQWMVDTAGMIAGGYKTFTSPDGQVFAKFSVTESMDTGVAGSWEFTRGTGKYEGITGRGDFTTTNVSETVYWDMLEGEYKIP